MTHDTTTMRFQENSYREQQRSGFPQKRGWQWAVANRLLYQLAVLGANASEMAEIGLAIMRFQDLLIVTSARIAGKENINKQARLG